MTERNEELEQALARAECAELELAEEIATRADLDKTVSDQRRIIRSMHRTIGRVEKKSSKLAEDCARFERAWSGLVDLAVDDVKWSEFRARVIKGERP